MHPAEYLDMQALERKRKSISYWNDNIYLSNSSTDSVLWRSLSYNEKKHTVVKNGDNI